MASFDEPYKHILKSEGGYHDGTIAGKKDTGGETYKGIARNYHPNWEGWKIIDNIKKTRKIKYNEIINDAELDRLHKEYVRKIFWNPIKGDTIKNQQFANFFVDFYYHRPKEAVQLVREAANFSGKGVTDQLIDKINSDSANIYKVYVQKRKDFYNSGKLGTSFIKAWINRVNTYPQEIAEDVKEVVKEIINNPIEVAKKKPAIAIAGVVMLTSTLILVVWLGSRMFSKKENKT